MSLRTDKVTATIEKVAGEYFAKTYAGSPTPISIVRMSVSPDLKHAQIWLSLLGNKTDELQYEILADVPALQRAVAKQLRTKFSPKIQVQFDDGLAHSAHISKLLQE